MIMEDLQHILPDQIKNISNRKAYIILAVLVGCFVVLSIGLAAALAVKHAEMGSNGGGDSGSKGWSPQTAALVSPPDPPEGVCVEADCLRTAAWMVENMNQSVDPCDNFYQYACGGWLDKHDPPTGWSGYSVYSQIRQDTEEKVRELVQSPHPINKFSSAEKKLKDFYSTCLHDYGRMEEGGKEVLNIIKTKLGGWYALDPENWQSTQWDFSGALTSVLSDYLVESLFRVLVYTDSRNRNRKIITLQSAYLGMYSNYYLDNNKAQVQVKYKNFIRDMGRLLLRDANVTLNDSQKEEALQTFVDDVYFQEKQIAVGITARRLQSGYFRSPYMTIGQLARNLTQIDWLRILRGYFGPDITSDTVISVRQKPYFDMINEILQNETESRNRILNNFLVWTFLDTYGHHLSWEYRMTAQYFNEPFRGPYDMIPTWMQCVETIEDRLGSIVAAEFVDAHVGEAGKQQVKDMFNRMLKASQQVVESAYYMDNVTKARAKEKLSKLKAILGFPDSYDKAFFNQLHSSLVINKSLGYFKNLMNTNVFHKKLMKLELDTGRKFNLWRYVTGREAFGTTLYYFYNLHTLWVPAGALRFPYLNPRRKSIIASGGFGSRLSQGVMHSVGDLGKSLWHNGSYWRWWTDITEAQYMLSRACFKEYMKQLKAGPFLIRGQNITLNHKDYSATRLMRGLAAVKVAYQTHILDLNATMLPLGVKLSSKQSFFLSYAQSKCSKRNDWSAYNRVRSGYILPETSVNSILGQMGEFSKAFQCSTSSKMNIANKCQFI